MNVSSFPLFVPLQSSTLPGDLWTVPQAVTLRRSSKAGEWVTHRKNVASGECWCGHYFIADAFRGGEEGAYRRALRDYVRRCGALGVVPFPGHPEMAPRSTAGVSPRGWGCV